MHRILICYSKVLKHHTFQVPQKVTLIANRNSPDSRKRNAHEISSNRRKFRELNLCEIRQLCCHSRASEPLRSLTPLVCVFCGWFTLCDTSSMGAARGVIPSCSGGEEQLGQGLHLPHLSTFEVYRPSRHWYHPTRPSRMYSC